MDTAQFPFTEQPSTRPAELRPSRAVCLPNPGWLCSTLPVQTQGQERASEGGRGEGNLREAVGRLVTQSCCLQPRSVQMHKPNSKYKTQLPNGPKTFLARLHSLVLGLKVGRKQSIVC